KSRRSSSRPSHRTWATATSTHNPITGRITAPGQRADGPSSACSLTDAIARTAWTARTSARRRAQGRVTMRSYCRTHVPLGLSLMVLSAALPITTGHAARPVGATISAGDPIVLDTGASFKTTTGTFTGGLFDIGQQSGDQTPI